MADKVIYIINFLFIAILATGCNQENSSGLIDESYLKSGDYLDFQQEFRQESALRKSQKRSFASHLQDLGNCSRPKGSFPLELDQKKIAHLLEASEKNCEKIITFKDLGFTFHLLMETSLENYVIKWVLLKQKSIYINWQLLAVVFNEGKIVNYRRVGYFEKNLTKDIDTELELVENGSQLLIKSEIKRKINYPIEQNNTVNRIFVVNSNGIIPNS